MKQSDENHEKHEQIHRILKKSIIMKKNSLKQANLNQIYFYFKRLFKFNAIFFLIIY